MDMVHIFDEDGGGVELSVVVPLYNEWDNVEELHRRLTGALGGSGLDYELVLVDDGSRDGTPGLLDEVQARDARVVVLHLSRNFGHQAAVCAGIDQAAGKAVVVMDGDLQDPPEVIPELVGLWREGNDVVYAVRRRRKEGVFKRLGYSAFYRLLRMVSDLEIPLDSGDFGLMDRKVVDSLKRLPEHKRFVRGLRAFVGFRQVGLPYDRPARGAGRAKYRFRDQVGLAVDGLVSFGSFPLRVVTYIGLATAALAVVLTAWVLTDAFVQKTAPRGWASLTIIVLFMHSVQMICMGIVGEYIRLIFLEAKGRPTYIVAERNGPSRAEGAGQESGFGPSPRRGSGVGRGR
jgi:dolichol-phosphate mannosyltransferase